MQSLNLWEGVMSRRKKLDGKNKDILVLAEKFKDLTIGHMSCKI